MKRATGAVHVLITEEMTLQKKKKKAFSSQSCKYFSLPSLSPEWGGFRGMMAWSICYFNRITSFSILLQYGIAYYEITFLNEILYCCSILCCSCNLPTYFLPLNIIVILTKHALMVKEGLECKRIKLFSCKN